MLSLLTKGPMKVIGKVSLVQVTARSNAESSKAFPVEKVSPAASSPSVGGLEPLPTWLKSREINALKSR